MGMTEDDKRNCCLLEIQETEAKYYRTLEDIEKVGGARASSWWLRGPLGRAVAGRGRRKCSAALPALPSGPPPATEAPLTSRVPTHPLSPTGTVGPGQAGVLLDLPIVPAPASCASALSLGPGPSP